MKRLVLSIVAASAVIACAAPSSEEGRAQQPLSSEAALKPPQAAEVVPYGYGPCAEEPQIGRVGFPGEKPVLIKRVSPIRPGSEREGFVVLQAIIDRNGKVCSAVVVRSLDPQADRAAIDAVKRWTFQPATYDGKPWPVEMHLTVDFSSHRSPN